MDANTEKILPKGFSICNLINPNQGSDLLKAPPKPIVAIKTDIVASPACSEPSSSSSPESFDNNNIGSLPPNGLNLPFMPNQHQMLILAAAAANNGNQQNMLPGMGGALPPYSNFGNLNWQSAVNNYMQMQMQQQMANTAMPILNGWDPRYPWINPYLNKTQQKRKGGQIRFSNEQTDALEQHFDKHKYLSPVERKKVAKSLSLSERQVKTWFQNRRAKQRRMGTEGENEEGTDSATRSLAQYEGYSQHYST